MFISKILLVIYALAFVHECFSKPTPENDVTRGRGFMSTLWDWITYPFTWWHSGETQTPVTEQLVGSTTELPTIEIGNHNVTIYCNDQICTTMKCDRFGCRNISCNLYDTDLRGECREYNFITSGDEHNISKPTEPVPKETQTKIPDSVFTVALTSPLNVNTPIYERPLELEAVISSTVNKEIVDTKMENKTESLKTEGLKMEGLKTDGLKTDGLKTKI